MRASGTAPPNIPEWMPWLERADGDDDPDHAPERRRQRRLADRPVHRVGEDDGVGPEPVTVASEDRREGVGPDLLLALDEHGDADGEVAGRGRAGRATCAMMPALSSAAPAAVQPAVALAGLERRASPTRPSPGGWTSWWA